MKRQCVTCQFFVPDEVEKGASAAPISGVCFYDRPVVHPVLVANPMTQQKMSGMVQARVIISDAQKEFCAQHLDVGAQTLADQFKELRAVLQNALVASTGFNTRRDL